MPRQIAPIIWALALALGGCIALAGCSRDPPHEPNLILITADQLAASDLACFGGPEASGKSVCRLGQQGTLFGWAMASGSGIASSAASMLTGLPSNAHGVDESGLTFLSDRLQSFPESLAQAGYATAAFIKSPALNRSRRLDQGFDLYDDRSDSESDLPERIQSWIATAREPRFVWIQLGSKTDLAEIDRLIARIESLLETNEAGTGVLFASLRGKDHDSPELGLDTHRIPMIWRAPTNERSGSTPRSSFALASPMDIGATLMASAHLPEPDGVPAHYRGRPLDALDTRLHVDEEERYLLLEGATASHEVGIASAGALYVRARSPLDVVGQPIPSTALADHAARFLSFALPVNGETKEAELPETVWRHDVLSGDSPVPRLEFHLERMLRKKTASAIE